MYEFTLMFTFFMVAVFLGIQTKRDVRYLGAPVMMLTVLGLGLAVSVLFIRADGVQPVLDSYWLLIHVSVATVSTGLFCVAAVFSVLQLLRGRRGGRPEDPARARVLAAARPGPGGAPAPEDAGEPEPGANAPVRATFLSRILVTLPETAVLERLAYRLNAVGFVTWTFTLVAGAIWAEHAWGRPWGWDPKETWTFVVWVIYAAYLHARVTAGWTAEKFAYFALAGFVALLANFYVVNIFFSSKHSYADG
jgi:cytochrome c-type biogenesis protein CcsB